MEVVTEVFYMVDGVGLVLGGIVNLVHAKTKKSRPYYTVCLVTGAYLYGNYTTFDIRCVFVVLQP